MHQINTSEKTTSISNDKRCTIKKRKNSLEYQYKLIAIRAKRFIRSILPEATFISIEEFIELSGIDIVAEQGTITDFCSRIKIALNLDLESSDSSPAY